MLHTSAAMLAATVAKLLACSGVQAHCVECGSIAAVAARRRHATAPKWRRIMQLLCYLLNSLAARASAHCLARSRPALRQKPARACQSPTSRIHALARMLAALPRAAAQRAFVGVAGARLSQRRLAMAVRASSSSAQDECMRRQARADCGGRVAAAAAAAAAACRRYKAAPDVGFTRFSAAAASATTGRCRSWLCVAPTWCRRWVTPPWVLQAASCLHTHCRCSCSLRACEFTQPLPWLPMQACERHKTSPTASAALGRALLGTLLMGAFRDEGERTQVRGLS